MTGEITVYHSILTRTLLIGSFLIFAAGASIPAAGGYWGMPFEQGLDWVAANPGRWTLTNTLFIASFLACLSGLVFFNQRLQPGTSRSIAAIGLAFFLIGTVFWFIDLGFRLGFEPWAAQVFRDAGELSETVLGLRRLQTTFFDLFMVLAFLSSAVYGILLVQSPSFPAVAGWLSIAYSVFFGILFVTTGGPIPVMVLVVPLVLGFLPFPA